MAFCTDLATSHALLTLTHAESTVSYDSPAQTCQLKPREGAQIAQLALKPRAKWCRGHCACHWPAPGGPGAQPRVSLSLSLSHARAQEGVGCHMAWTTQSSEGWGPRATAFRILPEKAESWIFMCILRFRKVGN